MSAEAQKIRAARHTLVKRIRAHMIAVAALERSLKTQKYQLARLWLIQKGYLQP